MHVDRERDAAEADKRYAEFLFAQSSPRPERIRLMSDNSAPLAFARARASHTFRPPQ